MKFDQLCTLITENCNTEQKCKSNAIISLPISMKKLSEARMGFDFGLLRGARGAKIKKLFEIKS